MALNIVVKKRQVQLDRQRPAKDLLRVIHILQANKSFGVTAETIAKEMEVSVRTVKRWLSAIKDIEPDLSYRNVSEIRGNLWYLPTAKTRITPTSADQLSSLKTISQLLKSHGYEEYSRVLNELSDVFKASADTRQMNRIDPDLEVLEESVRVTHSPGPKGVYEPMLRSALLEAILTEQQVQFTYKNTSDTKIDEKQVSPLGITLGPRVYLVAFDQSIKEIRNYALTGISNFRVLDQPIEYFHFDLNQYVGGSFGAFHDGIFLKWKLKFKSEAAPALYKYQFHPTQKFKTLDNGEIEISFYCESVREVALECFKWSHHLVSIKPRLLRETIDKIISEMRLVQ